MTSEIEHRCPVCFRSRNRDSAYPVRDNRDYGAIKDVDCEVCGKFTIYSRAAKYIESKQLGPTIASWVRTRPDAAKSSPEIKHETIEEILKLAPKYSVGEKQLLLLKTLENRTSFPGSAAQFNASIDFPLNWSVSESEFQYHIKALKSRGFIDDWPTGAIISPGGWIYLEQNRASSLTSTQGFVAMSFSKPMLNAWASGIKLAIERAGYLPFRTDASLDIDKIDARIVSEIRRSKFLVADVTEQRPGVYFEAGFAIALDKPVFWCVRENDLGNVHFDTRQYNHLVWKSETDLEQQLYYRITAILGIGPHANAA